MVRLSLLGEFRLQIEGHDKECPARCERLLSVLALCAQPVRRRHAAMTLWPDEPPSRAMGNLRSAIWGAKRIIPDIITCDGSLISLGPGVVIDLREALDEARRALNGDEPDEITFDLLKRDLLENWDDPWVLVERERFRQLRLHALEAACRKLAQAGSFCRAIDAGLLAVSAEPLRESAHRALIEAHLAEGNHFEANRQYRMYAALMDELGVEPSGVIGDLVRVDAAAGADAHNGVNGAPAPAPASTECTAVRDWLIPI
jgi:DNA-binding SARP family transcriptional activator